MSALKFSKAQLEKMAASVPFWFHSIKLGEGVSSQGWKSVEQLRTELEAFRLPELRGKTVLDPPPSPRPAGSRIRPLARRALQEFGFRKERVGSDAGFARYRAVVRAWKEQDAEE